MWVRCYVAVSPLRSLAVGVGLVRPVSACVCARVRVCAEQPIMGGEVRVGFLRAMLSDRFSPLIIDSQVHFGDSGGGPTLAPAGRKNVCACVCDCLSVRISAATKAVNCETGATNLQKTWAGDCWPGLLITIFVGLLRKPRCGHDLAWDDPELAYWVHCAKHVKLTVDDQQTNQISVKNKKMEGPSNQPSYMFPHLQKPM